MTVPVPLPFPGSRNLAAWWRSLAERQPKALWVGHLLLHRVEALVESQQTARPEALPLAVLKALVLFPGEPLSALDRRLHLGPQALRPVLNQLCQDGLAQADAAGWSPTPLGRRAAEQGDYVRPARARRAFHFRAAPDGTAHFLHLEAPAAVPWTPPADWHFEPATLARCLEQPADWKRRHAFPLEVEQLLGPEPAAPAWQRVIVDRPERQPVLLLLDAAGDRLLGFAVKAETWSLHADRPLFDLEAGGRDVFPDLGPPPTEDDWRQAWREWCQPRGLAALTDDAHRLEPSGPTLQVAVTPRLLERLRAIRSDALRDEAWLLVGDGPLRPAAQLKIVEAEGTPA
ncbi:MAG: hypothetical protein JNM56_23280 [Planctomycetia bacterium]|nr:hypothetical protein [Planctomycetia bacterium]